MKLITTRLLAGTSLFLVAVVIGGCLASDQLSTVTIHPDGSADVVSVRLNVHSTESGAKAEEELRRYREEFDAQSGPDHQRIVAAGGQIQESRWIRNQPPYSNLIVARLPTANALEKAFTFQSEKGESLVTARFAKDGARRKLALLVTLPADEAKGPASAPSPGEIRLGQANGISETRFAVSGGKIVDARGFTVASDKQSALLEPSTISQLLQDQRQIELFLAWEVAEP